MSFASYIQQKQVQGIMGKWEALLEEGYSFEEADRALFEADGEEEKAVGETGSVFAKGGRWKDPRVKHRDREEVEGGKVRVKPWKEMTPEERSAAKTAKEKVVADQLAAGIGERMKRLTPKQQLTMKKVVQGTTPRNIWGKQIGKGPKGEDGKSTSIYHDPRRINLLGTPVGTKYRSRTGNPGDPGGEFTGAKVTRADVLDSSDRRQNVQKELAKKLGWALEQLMQEGYSMSEALASAIAYCVSEEYSRKDIKEAISEVCGVGPYTARRMVYEALNSEDGDEQGGDE